MRIRIAPAGLSGISRAAPLIFLLPDRARRSSTTNVDEEIGSSSVTRTSIAWLQRISRDNRGGGWRLSEEREVGPRPVGARTGGGDCPGGGKPAGRAPGPVP